MARAEREGRLVEKIRFYSRGDGADGERIRFTSKVQPPFLRRTRKFEVQLNLCTT